MMKLGFVEARRKAMAARTARSRALYAKRGLATNGSIDRTTHAMLLRQLYLSLFEGRRFRQPSFDEADRAVLHRPSR